MSSFTDAAARYRRADSVVRRAEEDRIRLLRGALRLARESGLSIREAADEVGVPKSTVARMWPEPRVFLRDVKPYSAPERWDELRGPATGELELPHGVLWTPDRVVDLGTRAGRITAYTAVLEEGAADEQSEVLNPALLVEMWAELPVSPRVRTLWEKRFPQLRAIA